MCVEFCIIKCLYLKGIRSIKGVCNTGNNCAVSIWFHMYQQTKKEFSMDVVYT